MFHSFFSFRAPFHYGKAWVPSFFKTIFLDQTEQGDILSKVLIAIIEEIYCQAFSDLKTPGPGLKARDAEIVLNRLSPCALCLPVVKMIPNNRPPQALLSCLHG